MGINISSSGVGFIAYPHRKQIVNTITPHIRAQYITVCTHICNVLPVVVVDVLDGSFLCRRCDAPPQGASTAARTRPRPADAPWTRPLRRCGQPRKIFAGHDRFHMVNYIIFPRFQATATKTPPVRGGFPQSHSAARACAPPPGRAASLAARWNALARCTAHNPQMRLYCGRNLNASSPGRDGLCPVRHMRPRRSAALPMNQPHLLPFL